MSIRHLSLVIANRKKGYRRVTWRGGTKRALSSRFALHRVLPFHNDASIPRSASRSG